MQAIGRQPQRAPDGAPVHCDRHRPEQTTLVGLVQQHAATFFAEAEAASGADSGTPAGPRHPAGASAPVGAGLATSAADPAALAAGRAAQAGDACQTPVLQVVHRVMTRHLLDQAGPKADEADGGAGICRSPRAN